jgi:hypothetical protein
MHINGVGLWANAMRRGKPHMLHLMLIGMYIPESTLHQHLWLQTAGNSWHPNVQPVLPPSFRKKKVSLETG